jgi:hypothetical protein
MSSPITLKAGGAQFAPPTITPLLKNARNNRSGNGGVRDSKNTTEID